MKVKILKEGGILPQKKHKTDAGFDLYAPYDGVVFKGERIRVNLHIAISIAENQVALVQGRSGLAINNGITTIGNVIDSGYRGEISAVLLNTSNEDFGFRQGDRIAQLVLFKIPDEEVQEVSELSEADRGDNGFGSSGK